MYLTASRTALSSAASATTPRQGCWSPTHLEPARWDGFRVNWEGRSKGGEMAEYRAFVMGEDGHIRSSRAFVCDDDADATVWAKQLLDANDIELWSGERFVTRVSATVG